MQSVLEFRKGNWGVKEEEAGVGNRSRKRRRRGL